LNNTPDTGQDAIIALNRLATVARVVSGTAHDVNNALQIIGGSAELLENQPDLSEPARRALTRIRAQAARAAGLIEELSKFARDRGEADARVSLRHIAGQAIAFRGLMIRRAGLSLAVDPQTSPAAEVTGRAGQLLQAAVNMIIDAEAAFEGGNGGSITLTVTEDGRHAELRVANNGPDRSDRLPARGLADGAPSPLDAQTGLTAARLIAAAHGGELTRQSTAGGEVLILRLPLGAMERV
jgi:signal transduction histidine kinase